MNRSSQIDLYASEDVSDDSKKFQMMTTNAAVDFSGAQSAKFDFADYQFKDANGDYFFLQSRFTQVENDVSSNNTAVTSDITALQQADAAEQTARISKDTELENSIQSEIAARTTAVQAVQASLTAQIAAQQAAAQAASDARAQMTSDQQAAVAAETAARVADIAAVNQSIANVIGASTPEHLNDLSEIIAAYTSSDTQLAQQAAGILTRLAAVESTLNALVNSSLG